MIEFWVLQVAGSNPAAPTSYTRDPATLFSGPF
jgi:hypothetical protein